MSKNIEKLVTILSKTFEVEKNSIDDEASPNTIAKWDSFNTLKLFSGIEDEFEIKLTMNDMVAVKNVKDIKDLLVRYNVDLTN